MSLHGIHGAGVDRHPWLTWAIEMSFDVGVRLLYHKQEIFPEGFNLDPGTLVVSNHQRDSDVPIVGTTLCARRGLRFRWPLCFFVAREDLFRSGFLAEYFSGWLLVGRIRLQWFFAAAHAYPMRRVREFSLAETLDAVRAAGLGPAPVAQVFNARGERELRARLRSLPARVADLDRRRLRGLSHWGLRRLRLAALRQIAPAFRETVQTQLEVYVRLLNGGRVVYIAPEGLISKTGRFGRVRLGTRWLYRHAAQPPAMLPVALSYDALAPGRWRAVVHVGEYVRALDASSEAAFVARVRRMLQELYMLNPSHLLARFLSAGPQRFSTDEFCAWMRRACALALQRRAALDPLLLRASAASLWERRLRWLRRNHLVGREDSVWRNLVDPAAAPGWQTPQNVVRYLDNSFLDMAPELWRDLSA